MCPLSAIAKQLSASGAVKLADGSEVKRSDLDSYTMMTSLQSRPETMTTALGKLKQVVGNGRTVRVDVNQLNKYSVGVLDASLAKVVEAPVQRVESTLEEFDARVAEIGTQKVSETAKQVDKAAQQGR